MDAQMDTGMSVLDPGARIPFISTDDASHPTISRSADARETRRAFVAFSFLTATGARVGIGVGFGVGAGVGIVVGGTLRTVVLDEVDERERSAAQALVNIGIAIGNLLVVAVLSALADRAGGGLAGLQVAYLVATGFMLLMLLLSLRLRPQLRLPASP